MSWQTPGNDGPPAPMEPGRDPNDPETPTPDDETTRVPVPTSAEPVPPPPVTPGLISADPVGWAGQDPASPARPPTADGPVVPWVPPVVPIAGQVVEGVVIAGTFSRVVAYLIDSLFLGMINLAAIGALGAAGQGEGPMALVVGIAFVVVDFLYFVGLWRSGWHATLGMRLLRLSVLNAASANTLTLNDALLRWIALSGAIAILALVPRVAGTVGLLSLLWLLVLLITTATNPLHQGLHDRWARTVVVQPAPGGSGAAVVTCLVLLVLLFVVLPVVLVAVAGPQLQDILTQIGESI